MRDVVIRSKARIAMTEAEWRLFRTAARDFTVSPGAEICVIPSRLTGPEIIEFIQAFSADKPSA